MIDYAKELRFYNDVHKIQESLAKIAACLEKMSVPAYTIPADIDDVNRIMERIRGGALTTETHQD